MSSLSSSSEEYRITLWFNRNVIEDVAPLKGVKLDSLYLDDNRIKDISPLKDKEYCTFSVKNNLIDTLTLEVPRVMDHFRFEGNPVLERMSNILGSRIGEGVWVAIRLQTIDQTPDDIYPYAQVRECLEILKQRGKV